MVKWDSVDKSIEMQRKREFEELERKVKNYAVLIEELKGTVEKLRA